MIKSSDLRKLSAEDLEAKVQELRKEHFNARQAVASRKQANTAQIRSLRKDIARALQALAEKRSVGTGTAE